MTNEQLAILLNSYAARLEIILDDIESVLPAEIARAGEWWHDGERINDMQLIRIGLYGVGFRENLKAKGYELKPTGDALALNGMREFISGLREDASLLSSGSDREIKGVLSL